MMMMMQAGRQALASHHFPEEILLPFWPPAPTADRLIGPASVLGRLHSLAFSFAPPPLQCISANLLVQWFDRRVHQATSWNNYCHYYYCYNGKASLRKAANLRLAAPIDDDNNNFPPKGPPYTEPNWRNSVKRETSETNKWEKLAGCCCRFLQVSFSERSSVLDCCCCN